MASSEADPARLKFGFLSLHRELVSRIDPDGLLPQLVSAGVVTLDEKELVQSVVTAGRQLDKLLTFLHRHAVADPSVYTRMLSAMREVFFVTGDDLRKLADEVEAESLKEDVVRRFHYLSTVLEEGHNAALRTHGPAIAASLRVEEVLPRLVSAGAVTLEENAAIRAETSDSDKSNRLLRLVSEKGSLAFSKFAAALLESQSYQHLGKLLSRGDPYLETLVKTEGHQQLMQLLSVEETLDDEKYSEWLCVMITIVPFVIS